MSTVDVTGKMSRAELEDRCKRMGRLLVECRDALPAISLASARLHCVNLDLADRIEAALEPWKIS